MNNYYEARTIANHNHPDKLLLRAISIPSGRCNPMTPENNGREIAIVIGPHDQDNCQTIARLRDTSLTEYQTNLITHPFVIAFESINV